MNLRGLSDYKKEGTRLFYIDKGDDKKKNTTSYAGG